MGEARGAGGRGDGSGGLHLVDEPDKHATVPAPAQQHRYIPDRPSTFYRPSTPLYTPVELFSEWPSLEAYHAQPSVCHPQGERPDPALAPSTSPALEPTQEPTREITEEPAREPSHHPYQEPDDTQAHSSAPVDSSPAPAL
ncbi:early nodulin-like protein 1 [Lycium barbarum]|uniref:early nodulin-like protein 1 n=1 Tax=Lycium barbarum TaxID=112863 RepID=UPI00293E96F2|nr:early nodulin-like protein 1 [Lycium barbarum]